MIEALQYTAFPVLFIYSLGIQKVANTVSGTCKTDQVVGLLWPGACANTSYLTAVRVCCFFNLAAIVQTLNRGDCKHCFPHLHRRYFLHRHQALRRERQGLLPYLQDSPIRLTQFRHLFDQATVFAGLLFHR